MPIFLNPLVLIRLLCIVPSVLASTVHQEALTLETPGNTSPFLFSGNSDLPPSAFIATGLSGIASLADFLDSNPDLLVTHLLLSDSNDHDLQTGLHTTPLDDETIQGHSVVLHRLMSRVSPTLEVFSYSLYHWTWVVHSERMTRDEIESTGHGLFDHDFSRLRELTLRDVDIWAGLDCGQEDLYERPCVFPSLPAVSRLHLASEWAYRKLPSLTALRETLPALSHIRLTATPVPVEIQPRRAVDGSEHSSIPPNLTVLYSPGYSPDLDPDPNMLRGTPGAACDGLLESLGALTDQFGDQLRFIWPSEGDFRRYGTKYGIYSVGRAIGDFRARLMGEGEGEWSVTNGQTQ
ncbi:hypothetical protein VKT23_006516 [Stygiomarasmius scandens]|uniref:Uncharacterized protein n=1 Tax=Marasmiellus scandens TaxID=2682957 RepID=A0ABR1JNU0_9AGAR